MDTSLLDIPHESVFVTFSTAEKHPASPLPLRIQISRGSRRGFADTDSAVSNPSTASKMTLQAGKKKQKKYKRLKASEAEWSHLESIFADAEPPLDLTFEQTRDLLRSSQDPRAITERSKQLGIGERSMYALLDYIHSCLPGFTEIKDQISEMREVFTNFNVRVAAPSVIENYDDIPDFPINWKNIQREAVTYYFFKNNEKFSIDFSMVPTFLNSSPDNRREALEKLPLEILEEFSILLSAVYCKSPDHLQPYISRLQVTVNNHEREKRKYQKRQQVLDLMQL